MKAPPLGARGRPDPQGRPGYLHLGTAHPGDIDSPRGERIANGAHFINAVDAVTQFQAVVAAPSLAPERVCEALRPALTQTFPFAVINCHVANSSKLLSPAFFGMLQELGIGLSRSQRSGDNSLAKAKNAVVRRHFGAAPIPAGCCGDLNGFALGALYEHLNFHHPCCFASERADARGKVRRVYRPQDVMTPFEKLRSLPDAASHLRPGVTMEQLRGTELRMSDLESGLCLQQEERRLFGRIAKSVREAARREFPLLG